MLYSLLLWQFALLLLLLLPLQKGRKKATDLACFSSSSSSPPLLQKMSFVFFSSFKWVTISEKEEERELTCCPQASCPPMCSVHVRRCVCVCVRFKHACMYCTFFLQGIHILYTYTKASDSVNKRAKLQLLFFPSSFAFLAYEQHLSWVSEWVRERVGQLSIPWLRFNTAFFLPSFLPSFGRESSSELSLVWRMQSRPPLLSLYLSLSGQCTQEPVHRTWIEIVF